jgi:hypothetical protein
MRVDGILAMSRELSYTQAVALKQFLEKQHTSTSFLSIPLEITSDGRGLQWNNRDFINFPDAILATTALLKNWKIALTGVLHVVNKKESYDIILIKEMVKVSHDGKIVTKQLHQK